MKAVFSKFLRDVKLLFVADKLRFFLAKNKNAKNNKQFQNSHPDFAFPPDYLMYESFSLSYESYYKSGDAAAKFLLEIFKKYSHSDHPKILDWGCGPARVVRHIPKYVNSIHTHTHTHTQTGVYATDYNQETIAWNKNNIKDVAFNLNTLEAILPYENSFFDFVYGISIFTHLSGKMHIEWRNELSRVIKKDGILLLTMQGNFFKSILTESEIKDFEADQLVVRGNVKEGHRTYSAFHPDKFVNELFKGFTVLEHQNSYLNNGRPEQDVWVLKKK